MRIGSSRSPIFKFLCLVLFSVGAISAPASTIHVPTDQPTIQAGINAASNGDMVLVAPGTYYENIDFKGKAITVTSSGGAAQTIIDGGYNNPAVTFKANEARSSILNGFTIQHGGIPNLFFGDAGIYVTASEPTITNNIITHNQCRGIHIYVASPLIQGNNINNTEDPNSQCAFAGGSAIWVEGAYQGPPGTPSLPPAILGNTIENNTQSGKEDAGGSGGAGIAVWGGNPVIQNNTIRNNATYGTGGGINITSGGAIVVQNLIYDNTAAGAGGLAFDFGTAQNPGAVVGFVINNTIANNTLKGQYGYTGNAKGSQIYVWLQSSQTAFVNNIVYGSSSDPLVICDPTWEGYSYQDTIFDHNDFYNFNSQGTLFGGTCTDKTGTFGNISADPLFVNASLNDFHLTAASPAIDAGNNSAWDIPAKDFDNNPRLQDVTGKNYPIIDLGAYEFSGQVHANPTLLTLVPSAYVINAGVGFTLSSQLVSASGTPTGTVTFFEDGNQIGSTVIDGSGNAVLSSLGLTPGLHSFVATYPGQGAFSPATSVVSFVIVNKYVPVITLTSSPNPSLINQPVTFTITATSPDNVILSPITLTEGSTTLATLTPNSSGTATYTTSSLTLGTHLLQASYAGDATHAQAGASLSQTVVNGYPTPSTLTSSQNPASIGQPITFTDTITFNGSASASASGTVTFYDNNGVILLGSQAVTAQPNSTATATFSTSALAIGTHNISAVLTSGNAYSSAATLNQVILGLPTTTMLAATPLSGYALQPTTLSATVTGAGATIPTGTVTFYDGASALGSAALDNAGHAALTTSTLTGGTHLLHAVYNGDSTFASSTSPNISVTLQLIPTSTALSITPNPSVGLQVVTATVQVAPITSPQYSSLLCLCSVTLTIAGLPSNVAPTYTLPVHNGTVTFNFGLGFSAGTYTLSAAFSGSTSFAASTSSTVQQIVVPAPTAITLTASPNPVVQHQSVNLTAVLAAPLSAAISSGVITFLDGTVPIGSASFGATGPIPVSQASNTATVTVSTSNLGAGTHTITASYAGNTSFLPAVSAPLILTVTPQDYTLTTPNPAISIKTEHHLAIQVNLASIGGFADNIALACTDLPAHASCTFNKNSVQLLPNGTATTNVTIDTDDVLGYARNEAPRAANFITYALLPASLLTLFAARRRRSLLRLLLMLIAISGLALVVNGCSGLYPKSTAPGTYTINLSGVGANTRLTHAQTITLTVTP
jgi:parallel beta-helix repeat protein